MRASSFAVFAGVLVAACATGNPYGPSGEERLDSSTADISSDPSVAQANAKHLEAIQADNCDGSHAQLAALPKKDKTEEAKLADLTGLVTGLRQHKKAMDEVLDRHPGLKFFKGKAADGRTYDIEATAHTCATDLSDVEGRLDTLIRDIVRAPIVSKLVGRGRHRRMLPQPRVDFDLLRKAIVTLAPVDAEALMTRVDHAKAELAKEKGRGHHRYRHHRRHR